MVTDDPGTPGNGHWEINIAGLLTANAEQTLLLLPYFDINYGVGDKLQLKVETGWATSRNGPPSSQSIQSGADTLLVGVKYRFLEENQCGVAVSTYPQFQFHPFFSCDNSELTEPGNQVILPLEFSKTFGVWEFNPEIGYLRGSALPNPVFYGVVLAFENAKPWEPLAEIHVNTDLDGTGSVTLLNLGIRYTLNAEMNLLAALGHTVTSTNETPTELDAYAGIQLEL